ncbi:DNA mismatch repair protein MutS [Anoxybacillus suryakundensis]|uniref:DNA mismatch repair protein MutS n=1 Tax=Anoxybacillus suryakundensis TaxID=1325335 RepID=A0A0K6GNQ4_9BACL|nr:DNA mismatch repair protein MutS [Anoxybacillus suryakundensis]CUA80354.1 DNA mismatch repair protein MutS [Anoxybacillus suryakundensis]
MTYTPMIQQYLAIKSQYKDAFLFFRLGDFYEMFFEDAIKASQELEITLTSRDGGGEERVPMCGVPYHSAAMYIERLIEKGYKVAICEQVEDPKTAKGVVRREVVQLITPGTVMEGKQLEEKANNYLTSLTSFEDGTYGLAYTDLTTGESRITLLHSFEDVFNEIYSIGTKEIVVATTSKEQCQSLQERYALTVSCEDETMIPPSCESVVSHLKQEKLLVTFGRLLNYLVKTQKRNLTHLQPVELYEVNSHMKIDMYSKRNLELTETMRTKGKAGSLFWLLDETMTAMGGRLLKQWIDRPLLDREKIEQRLHFVEQFLIHYFERQELREYLRSVYDLERLAGRVAFGNVNARDLVQLKKSLKQVPFISSLLMQIHDKHIQSFAQQLDACEELVQLLEEAIEENPPLSVKEGGIIKDGYNETLDRFRDASRNGKTWIAQLEAKERELTGIKSLKIGYNRVFGYYIEVTKANLHLLPEGRYERKQTLANAERFVTKELKEKEALILEAEEKSIELEYELFVSIREQVKQYIARLQKLAKNMSQLDVLQCFATVSEKYNYCKPQFSHDRRLVVRQGRHPVVEKVLGSNIYVPNDCYMDAEREMLLITGPNMSGKSTYMRQIALTAIMAQIGCFVPAEEAILPIFDQVFTRIGAADDLVAGQSTFMVEMLEARHAIVHATQNSLILFDEIGRGTSTYDGMALAQAMIEYIHDRIGAKTLFSTHYHELTALEQRLPRLKNVHVSAVEENGKVIFLHKIKEGPADKSYGIHVAHLAKLPLDLIQRAEQILFEFESNSTPIIKDKKEKFEQLSMFEERHDKVRSDISKKEKEVIKRIQALDLLDMTPLEAMNKLYDIQKLLK